jgi:hypothetical protein
MFGPCVIEFKMGVLVFNMGRKARRKWGWFGLVRSGGGGGGLTWCHVVCKELGGIQGRGVAVTVAAATSPINPLFDSLTASVMMSTSVCSSCSLSCSSLHVLMGSTWDVCAGAMSFSGSSTASMAACTVGNETLTMFCTFGKTCPLLKKKLS